MTWKIIIYDLFFSQCWRGKCEREREKVHYDFLILREEENVSMRKKEKCPIIDC